MVTEELIIDGALSESLRGEIESKLTESDVLSHLFESYGIVWAGIPIYDCYSFEDLSYDRLPAEVFNIVISECPELTNKEKSDLLSYLELSYQKSVTYMDRVFNGKGGKQ